MDEKTRAVRAHKRCVLLFSIQALCASVAPLAAFAQITTGYVDLTAANTHYGDTFSGNSYSIGPRLRVEDVSGIFEAGGSYATLAGSWTAQGDASGSLFTRRAGLFMGEVGGFADGSTNAGGSRTASVIGVGRAHLLTNDRGAWIGAGGGRVWDGLIWRNLRQGEGGAWASIPHGTVSFVVTPTQLADTIRYTDGQASLSVFHDRVGINLDAGFRVGASLPVSGGDKNGWGSATATLWLTNFVALVASAGTYPVNFGQGFPGGRFISGGIRIGTMPGDKLERQFETDYPVTSGVSPTAIGTGLPTAPVDKAAGATGKLRVEQVGAERVRVSIVWPSATSIEIAGDFSNWDPIPLRRGSDGAWAATIIIPPGTHETNIRADGGRWVVPPGLGVRNDEFGGQVGLLIVGM